MNFLKKLFANADKKKISTTLFDDAVDSSRDNAANGHDIKIDFDEDTKKPIRLGLYVLLIGFGLFLLWAALAPLDEGVPAQGIVSIDTKKKTLQHLTGGIIKEVRVKEGEFVKTNQVLIILDGAITKSRLEETKQKYIGDRALESRLIAEQQNLKEILFHEDLEKMRDQPLVLQHMKNQERLLASRRASLKSERQGIQEAIYGQEAQIEGYVGVLESRRSQFNLLDEQLTNIRKLVDEGFAPRNQQKELELRIAQVNGDIADTESNIKKSKRMVAELKQRLEMRTEDYKKEVDTQMAQVRIEVDANSDKFKALLDELDRLEIKAPVDGQVIGMQFQNVGAVIQGGQRVMDVVPAHEDLLVEVRVLPHLVDRIQPDQDADIRFSNFANAPQLKVLGKVNSVSHDLLTDPNTNPNQPGASYYLARILVTKEGMKTLNHRVLQPGMPVQVIIKTGERSLLNYLIHPLIKRIAASMKEV